MRFKHDPESPHGFVGAALSSNVIHITRDAEDGKKWAAKVGVQGLHGHSACVVGMRHICQC